MAALRFVVSVWLTSTLLISAGIVAWAARQPDVEVTAMALHRDGNLILVDATLKNAGARPLKGLTAILRFYSPRHEVMSTQRIAVDEPVLEPGAESEIHAQLTAPAKAVTAEFSAATS